MKFAKQSTRRSLSRSPGRLPQRHRRVPGASGDARLPWRSRFVLLLGAAVLSTSAWSCVTDQNASATITKVNPYHLKRKTWNDRKIYDEMIRFEQDRRLRGAVTREEIDGKLGHYFTVFWTTKQPKVPATVRLEYRQSATNQIIHAKESEVASPKRRNVNEFQVTGDEYSERGNVTQWRALVLQNGEVVAEYKSFLWK